MSFTLLILKINTTFEDVQMMLKLFFDFSTGFRFSKISVECSVHICSCPWFNLSNSLKSIIWSFELFQFSAYFLSNMILQCMTIYLYGEKPVWLWCQYWIRPNIAANTKNPGVSQNHEKSSYRINCRVFIITVFSLTCWWSNLRSFDSTSIVGVLVDSRLKK